MSGYYFNLPPVTELTVAQQSALNETEPIALSGGPGTGKSVVSVWRHMRNFHRGRPSLLLTYTHTLKQYLRSCCQQQEETRAANHIGTSFADKPVVKGIYQEIIIDEAQDLAPDYYNDIRRLGIDISYGADDSQILYRDHCSTTAELQEMFPDNVQCLLDKNFRSTQNIMLFARHAFRNLFVPQDIIDGLADNPGMKPVVAGGLIFNKILTIIKELGGEESNIGILTPWKKDVAAIDGWLTSQSIDHSAYASDENGEAYCPPIKNIHVTTYRSAKGLEFDTVILPEFDYFYFQKKPRIINGNDSLSEEDMYVAVTRARSNLFLLNQKDNKEFNKLMDGYVQI